MTVWVNQLYSQIKQQLVANMSDYWPDFNELVHSYLDNDPYLSELTVLFYTCKLVGGEPKKSIELCAGILAIFLSVQITENLQNYDRQDVRKNRTDTSRAFNFTFSLSNFGYQLINISPILENKKKEIVQILTEGIMLKLAGQDRELKGENKTWDEYWYTAEMRTSFVFSSCAGIGAILGTDKQSLIQASQTFGYHFGQALHILREIKQTWNSDVQKEQITLPILYGVYCEHFERKELLDIIWNKHLIQKHERVINILDNIDAKNYFVHAALDQRKKAIESIEIYPDHVKNSLSRLLDSIFENLEELLEMRKPKVLPMVGNALNDHLGAKYKSNALKIRKQLRYA